jgi:FixJ family two-component response regulator
MNSDEPIVFVVDDDYRAREALSSLIACRRNQRIISRDRVRSIRRCLCRKEYLLLAQTPVRVRAGG